MLSALLALVPARPATSAVHRSRILIYYANETTPEAATSDNDKLLLATLRKSHSPLGRAIAEDVVADTRLFPAAVEREVQNLTTSARRAHVDLIVFTNELTLKGEYLVYRAGLPHPRTLRLPAMPPVKDSILATSPLARPEVFERALDTAVSLYPPDSVDAVLITVSHGTADMAMVPRVNTDLSVGTPAELIARLSAVDSPIPTWAALQGTSKVEYWRRIANATIGRGVRLALVFRAACASGIWSWREFSEWPQNMDAIAHTENQTLLDSQMIRIANFQVEPGETWVQGIENTLDHNGIHVNEHDTAWIWVVILTIGSVNPVFYFIPLLVWLLCFAIIQLDGRKRRIIGLREAGHGSRGKSRVP